MQTDNPRVAMLFPAAGRKTREAQIAAGEAPGEFLYGGLAYGDRNPNLTYGDTRKDPASLLAPIRLWLTAKRNSLTNFGLVRPRVEALAPLINEVDLAMAFTDAFSISLGYYRNLIGPNTVLAGGFHGLSDMVQEVTPAFRSGAERAIRRGLHGLDFAFFFGPADRDEAIRRYGLSEDRTMLFPFGVDTSFWSPGESAFDDTAYVFAAGSDPKRDYRTLLASRYTAPTTLLTRLPIDVSGREDVTLVKGSYHDVAVTDPVLRDLYRGALAVVVPIREVFQPSGYSVTLQAMACGKPVVLSRIKGLWDPEQFRDGENCLLVEPENPDAFGSAVQRLVNDPALRERIGTVARKTAETVFGLDRMNTGLERLVEKSLAAGRVAAS